MTATSGEEETTVGDTQSNGSTFVAALGTRPPHLVRMLQGDPDIALVGLAMQESLVVTDRDNEILPSLAESWDIEEDGALYRFYLREGVTWHDGEPFDAEDVVYTFENTLGLSSGTAALESSVESVEMVDSMTVEVRLSEPSGFFLANLNPMVFSVMPEHIYGDGDPLENEANQAPIGTGPYRFESWDGSTITLVANEDYWGDQPTVERLVYRVMPDSNSRVIALENGEIDYINAFQLPFEAARQLEDVDGVRLEVGRTNPSMQMLPFNLRNETLADPEVRKALLMAIDRQFISDAVFGGGSPPSKSALPQSHWSSSPTVDYMEQFPYDPEAAEAMLDDAGVPRGENGARFTMRLRYRSDIPGSAGTAEVIERNWNEIGVPTEVIADDAEVFGEEVYTNHNFDAFIINIASGPDPNISLYTRYTCDNGRNVLYGNATGYCNEDVDRLFAEAGASVDRDERAALYDEAQQILADDLPTATLVDVSYTDAVRSDWGGLDDFFDGSETGILNWESLAPPS